MGNFRRIYLASILSNTGRWMQQAALGVLAWKLTESPAFLGLIIFAQLAPMALLSLLGGTLADAMDRRKLLLATQTWQMTWSFVLAGLVADGTISRSVLLAVVFVIGLGQGIFAPVFTSVIPTLVGKENLQAAVALNSMQVNGSRVLGPAIGGYLVSILGFSTVFALNAASYLIVIWALWVTPIPSTRATQAASLSDRVFGGFKIAARAPQVGRPILMMTLFSLFCLPFIGQMPAIAELNLGIDSESKAYGWFYACFGLGALVGTTLVGTVLLRANRDRVVHVTLIAFAIALAALAFTTTPALGYAVIFLVGLFYFVLPTTLATLWQEHITDSVRGRVSALWTLSFGGTIPFANIIAGPLVEATSLRTVLVSGAISALVIAATVKLRDGPPVGEQLLAAPSGTNISPR